MNKISTFKIAFSFVVLIAAVYFGYQAYAHSVIDSKKFPAIAPGKVTLLGIDLSHKEGSNTPSDLPPGMTYKIVVANSIAQLEEVPDGKFQVSDDAMGGDNGDSSDKKHVPLKEAVESLQGDTKALGELVTIMNDDLRKEREDIPPKPVVWAAEDIVKATNGDPALLKKLTHDINVNLDGSPADFITINALYNGITIDLPVPVMVNVKGVPQTLVSHVRIPYRAAFTKRVTEAIANDQSKDINPTPETIKGYYLQEAAKMTGKKGDKEDVKTALLSRINAVVVATYASSAERILSKAQVVLNDSLIKDAHMDENTGNDGKPIYDLVLDLTDEGRNRLWQYSRNKVGTQLLLIVDGVAIAAPTVRHELAQSTVTITQMPDKSLIQDAIDDIRTSAGKVASK
ncbi:MAG TPA: hypothetical protein VGL56_13305 [Fimbriimonadaceae bacterium]